MKSSLNYYLALRSFSAEVLKILVSQAFLGLSNGIFGVLYNIYLKIIGYKEDTIGRLLSLQTIISAISGFLLSYILKKFSKAKLYCIGICLLSVGYFLVSSRRDLGGLVVASIILGLGHGAMIVTVLPLLQEHSYSRQKPFVFSINFSILLLMNIIAGFLAGWLPSIFRGGLFNLFDAIIEEAESLQYTIRISAFLPIFSLILGIYLQEKEISSYSQTINLVRKEKRIFIENLNDTESNIIERKKLSVILWLSKLNIDTTIIKFSFVSAIIGAGAGMTVPYFNLYFREWIKASIKEIGILFSLNQLGTAVGSFVTPYISKKLSAPKGAVITISLSLPFLLILAVSKNFYLCAFAYVVRGALMNMSTPLRQQAIMEFVPTNLRSLAIACDSMSWNFFWAISMFFSGGVIKNYGFSVSFIITFTLYSFACAMYYKFFVRK